MGWRLGLQEVTGLLVSTFLLGTFYRSASLYHPQRRAILHLKTQKRKIKSKDKEKNKMQDDRPPFFEFTTLKSRTVQIILLSTFLCHLGIFTPLFFLVSGLFWPLSRGHFTDSTNANAFFMQAKQTAGEKDLTKESIVQLQTFLGLAWALGSVAFGLVTVGQSAECRIARQYLTQASVIMTGLSIFALTVVKRSYSGYVMFAWIYGAFHGGYAYSLKMYIYEKVRARNFARAWGFAQFAMGLPAVIGITISAAMSSGDNFNLGYYFSAACVIFGGLIVSLVDFHKKRLRRKRRLRQCKSTASTATAATSTTFNSSTGTIHHHRGLYSSNSQTIETPKNSVLHYDFLHHSNPPSVHSAKDFHFNSHSEAEVKEDLLANSLGLKDAPVYDEVASSPKHQMLLVRSHSEADTPQDSTDGRGSKKLKKLMSLELIEQGEMDIINELEEEDALDPDEYEEVYNIGDLDPDEIEYLEGITSCNNVDNCVVFSEFEQNLLKESGGEFQPAGMGAISRGGSRSLYQKGNKKWYKKKRKGNASKATPEVAMNKSKRWNQVLPGPSKEMATVIEETTSTV